MHDTATQPRRRFRFHLLTLLIVVVVVAGVLGWVGNKRRRTTERRLALEDAGFELLAIDPQPQWHRLIFGDDSLSYVREVGIGWLGTDDELVHLEELTQLQVLHLDRSKITDSGLVHLKGLTQLQWLFLQRTRVTRAGLTELRKALPQCFIVHESLQ